MQQGADYRTSAAPGASVDSACLLCGAERSADQTCITCSVPMPRLTCRCGVINGVGADRCRECGAALVEARPHPRACPRCSTPLTEIGIDPSASVHVCLGCRGVFVPPRGWYLLLGRGDLVDALAARLPAAPAAPLSVLPAMFHCPECTGEMERGRFAATSTIVIDACALQHGLWLDAGELVAAVGYAKHRREIGYGAAVAEAEAVEREQSGYDAEQARSELARLDAVNARDLPVIARQASGQPSGKSFLLVLGAVVLLTCLGQLGRVC